MTKRVYILKKRVLDIDRPIYGQYLRECRLVSMVMIWSIVC